MYVYTKINCSVCISMKFALSPSYNDCFLSLNSVLNLNFPSLIKKITQTDDSLFLVAHGEYPPQIRCYDLSNLTCKFQRMVSSEIRDISLISQNWERLAILRSDKFIEFHSKSGYYYQSKLPKNGKTTDFDRRMKILYIASNDNEIYRLDLEYGKFTTSIRCSQCLNSTCLTRSSSENLLAVGSEQGLIEIWDTRMIKKAALILDSKLHSVNKRSGISCLNFSELLNYKLYCGQFSGDSILYDLRNNKPIIWKKIGNDLPLVAIGEGARDVIVSVNKKIIKIWNESNGKSYLTMKSVKDINHACFIKNTGLIVLSTTASQADCCFSQFLGPVPGWMMLSKEDKFKKVTLKNRKPTKSRLRLGLLNNL